MRAGSEHRAYVRDRSLLGPGVDGRRASVESQLGTGDRPAHQCRRVQFGSEGGRLEDADHGEPLPADQHPGPWPRAAETEPLGRRRTEDGRRVAAGGGVQPDPAGDLGRHGGRQILTYGVGGQTARLHLGDLVAAVHLRPLDRTDRGDRLHRADPADHRLGVLGQLGGVTGHRRPGGDGQQIGAQGGECAVEPGARRGRDPHDPDHRRDADGDAERGQERPQRSGPQAHRPHLDDVPGAQPGRSQHAGGGGVERPRTPGHRRVHRCRSRGGGH